MYFAEYGLCRAEANINPIIRDQLTPAQSRVLDKYEHCLREFYHHNLVQRLDEIRETVRANGFRIVDLPADLTQIALAQSRAQLIPFKDWKTCERGVIVPRYPNKYPMINGDISPVYPSKDEMDNMEREYRGNLEKEGFMLKDIRAEFGRGGGNTFCIVNQL